MHALIDSLPRGGQPRPARIVPLPDYAVIAARGADAPAFLQGQLTQDILGLAGRARPAGYCTAKGRLLGSMVVWHDEAAQTVFALVRRDVAEALVKRLSMFVLRAKAKLTVEPLAVAGVWAGAMAAAGASPAAGDAQAPGAARPAGAADIAALSEAAGGPLPASTWERAILPSGTWIGAPAAGGGRRWWWVADEERSGRAAPALAGLLSPGDAGDWAAADAAAGLPWIEAATQDVFIPQTVNLDLIGGVSFDKGCYPGQEVVARSHYRGTLKRRMAYGVVAAGEAAGRALPGADIYEAGEDNPCGRVVNVAPSPQGAALLFEASFDALARGALRLGAPDGPELRAGTLPYEVPVPA